MKEAVISIFYNTTLMWWIMAAVIFILTQAIKQPIKKITQKIGNGNELIRKKVNTVICIIPFVLGIIFDLFYSKYSGKTFNIAEAIFLGGQSIAMYGIFERFFCIKIENPYNTEQGEKVIYEVTKKANLSKEEKEKLYNLLDLNDEERK